MLKQILQMPSGKNLGYRPKDWRVSKNLVFVEAPKAGGILVKSAGETLRVAGEEAVLLKDLTVVGVKRGVTDVTAMTLIVESAAEKPLDKLQIRLRLALLI